MAYFCVAWCGSRNRLLYYGSDGITSAPRNIYIGDDSSGKYLGLYNHIGVTVYTDKLIN